jgi:hypothetical protein
LVTPNYSKWLVGIGQTGEKGIDLGGTDMDKEDVVGLEEPAPYSSPEA